MTRSDVYNCWANARQPTREGKKNPFQSETHVICKRTTNVFQKHLCNVFPFTRTSETKSLMPELPAIRAASQQLCPHLCSAQPATTRNLLWQLEMDECDLTWVWNIEGCVLELLGKGSSFIKGHTQEGILLPVFADNEKTCDNQTGSHLGAMRKWV